MSEDLEEENKFLRYLLGQIYGLSSLPFYRSTEDPKIWLEKIMRITGRFSREENVVAQKWTGEQIIENRKWVEDMKAKHELDW